MKRNFFIPKGKKLLINEKGRKRYIDIENITHITCEGHISTIHTINNKSISVYKLLKEFEKELQEYKFVRTHHKSICCLFNVSEYKKINKKHILVLKNNQKVEISARKLPIVLKLL